MNDHDKSNLNFILNLDEDQFDKWYAKISPDDVDYAIELLKQARSQLYMAQSELLDPIEDVTEAKSLLKKFML